MKYFMTGLMISASTTAFAGNYDYTPAPEYQVTPEIIYEPQPVPPAPDLGYYDGIIPEEASAARPVLVNQDPYNIFMDTNYDRDYYDQRIVIAQGAFTTGNIVYSFNSDNPLPSDHVYAKIQNTSTDPNMQPLDGALLTGNIQSSPEGALIEFTEIQLRNGARYGIEAVAVSPARGDTLVGNVNRHIFQRYGALFLAGIVEGIGEYAQLRLGGGGDTIVINTGDGNVDNASAEFDENAALASGLKPAAQNLTNALQQNANRPNTVTIPAGQFIGVLFTSGTELGGQQ